MIRISSSVAAIVLAGWIAVPSAQIEPARPAPEPPNAVPPAADQVFDTRGLRGAIRVGRDLNIAEGDAVREATVVFGDVTVAGQVDNDLVVILGTVRLASTARIGGDFVAVGGNVTAESGAYLRRDMVIVGGNLDAPFDFAPGGEHVVIGGPVLHDWLSGVMPYLVRGPLWGRPIVPELPWVWAFLAAFFLLYLTINVLFDRPVYACASTLKTKPLTAFGAGLLVLLLFGPVSLLLAVSVVGIVVVPFVICALLAGWILGKVAVARSIGMSLAPEDSGNRAHATRSFLIGFVLITIAYCIPVIGLIAWAMVGVFGLGAAALAFVAAYRRENPKPVAPMPAPAESPLPSPAYVPPIAAIRPEPEAPMAYQPAAAAGPALAAVMPRALFRDRLAAFILDVILVLITVNVLAVDAEEMFLPFLVVYHIAFWTWKQTTVGGTICQLRVVRIDGTPLSFADALVRGLSAMFSIAVFFIGALWILRDPERQAWHDKIAGTYVVKVPRDWPL